MRRFWLGIGQLLLTALAIGVLFCGVFGEITLSTTLVWCAILVINGVLGSFNIYSSFE